MNITMASVVEFQAYFSKECCPSTRYVITFSYIYKNVFLYLWETVTHVASWLCLAFESRHMSSYMIYNSSNLDYVVGSCSKK